MNRIAQSELIIVEDCKYRNQEKFDENGLHPSKFFSFSIEWLPSAHRKKFASVSNFQYFSWFFHSRRSRTMIYERMKKEHWIKFQGCSWKTRIRMATISGQCHRFMWCGRSQWNLLSHWWCAHESKSWPRNFSSKDAANHIHSFPNRLHWLYVNKRFIFPDHFDARTQPYMRRAAANQSPLGRRAHISGGPAH